MNGMVCGRMNECRFIWDRLKKRSADLESTYERNVRREDPYILSQRKKET